MNKSKIKKTILLITLVVGLLLVGIGFGIAVGEITDLNYGGTTEIFEDRVKVETISCQVPIPKDNKKIKLPSSVYHYIDSKSLAITPDNSLPMGVVNYEVIFNSYNVDRIEAHFDEETSQNSISQSDLEEPNYNDDELDISISEICLPFAQDEILRIINSYIDINGYIDNYSIDELREFLNSEEIQNIINDSIDSEINDIISNKINLGIESYKSQQALNKQKQESSKYLGEIEFNVFSSYNGDMEAILTIMKAIKQDLKDNKLGNYRVKYDTPQIIKISANPKMIEYLETI